MDSKNKIKVLILIDWYLPGYKAGGPVQSVANLVERLKGQINFSIVTRDTDFRETLAYPGIKSDQWLEQHANVRIHYLSKKNQNLRGLKRVIDPDQYDYIYLNSVFSYPFTLAPLFAFRKARSRMILAPRGMLGGGALRIKRLKKILFLLLTRYIGLYAGIRWQATDEAERADILALFGAGAKVIIASNIPASVPKNMDAKIKAAGDLKLVYLSRISEKKNLVELLLLLKNTRVKGKIVLDLYGPIEDAGYWNRCRKIIRELPDNILAQSKGAVNPNEVHAVLSQYHFFTLLTGHENFGHAIFEALSAGCPLIISDNTPWHGLEAKGIGWNISIYQLQRFEEIILNCLEMGQSEYAAISGRAHSFALEFSETDPAVERSLNLFKD